MSWSDVCSNCHEHRAECKCEDWRNYKFNKWMETVNNEKEHYPLFKGRELNEQHLKDLFKEGKEPIDALNDLITAI